MVPPQPRPFPHETRNPGRALPSTPARWATGKSGSLSPLSPSSTTPKGSSESFSTSWAERSYPRSHRSMNLTITACRDSSTPPAIPSARRRLRFPSPVHSAASRPRPTSLSAYRSTSVQAVGTRVSLPSATAPAMFGGAYDRLCRRSPTCCTITHGTSLRIQRGGISPTMRGRYSEYRPKDAISRRDGEYGYFNGFDRPQWTLRVEAETNPGDAA